MTSNHGFTHPRSRYSSRAAPIRDNALSGSR
jgi:hypothetical protein